MQDGAVKLHPYARRLRNQQTDAERKLWNLLRNRQLHSFKFRRQHPIGSYIVDFCCLEQGLVVELDGGHHLLQKEQDQCRTHFLAQGGYRLLRFWDHEVLTQPEAVLQSILEELQSPSPLRLCSGQAQPSPFQGEGDTILMLNLKELLTHYNLP